MNFISLTGYYPQGYELFIDPHAIVAFGANVTNPKSKGSIVHLAGATTPFQVSETPGEISELLGVVEEVRRG